MTKVGPNGEALCNQLFSPVAGGPRYECARYAGHLPVWHHSAQPDPPKGGWACVGADRIVHVTDGQSEIVEATIESRYRLVYQRLWHTTRCGLSTREMRPPALADLGALAYCEACLPYG